MEEEMEMEIQIQMLPSSLSVSLGNMYGVKSCIGIWGGCDGGVAVLGDGRDMEEGEVGISVIEGIKWKLEACRQ